jgi:hypothetical protein
MGTRRWLYDGAMDSGHHGHGFCHSDRSDADVHISTTYAVVGESPPCQRDIDVASTATSFGCIFKILNPRCDASVVDRDRFEL